ncbi:DUF2207 domain-containing protein [Thermomonospora umbrina]|nr:DUF2207 domain-containing protein [Thermomonospora umbrina]
MRDMVWVVAIAVGIPLAIVCLALPAHAAPGESIPTYDVVLEIRPDGVLHVRETITYDFRGRGEHGIVRRVPYRIENRLYDIRNVRTSSSTGAPARARARKMLHEVHIDVGGERRRVGGRQAYVIEYDVVGVMTPHPGRVELRWDAVGAGWDVPIGEVSVRVEVPARPLRVGCRAGSRRHARGDPEATGLTRCGGGRDGPYAVDFTQGGLGPHESVLIVVRLPEGAVHAAPPRYARPHFTGSWLGYTALLVGLGVGPALLLPWARARRRPGRRVGAGPAGAGFLLVTVDVADDVLARGVWAASVGDLTLTGLGLLAAGSAMIFRSGRPGVTERAASEDQRA